MLYTSVLINLVALAAAAQQGIRPWQAPGPGDSRSPCPMLNTLANHGYLYVPSRITSGDKYTSKADQKDHMTAETSRHSSLAKP